MCGISGVFYFNGRRAQRETIARMMAMGVHRGPDAYGFHLDGPVGLAHARLSIIDLVGGVQPMSTADGRYWISFNGEIFNYIELRNELEARGARFRTRSDTEVVLQSFAFEGPDCVQRFNGQWAFAIWDSLEKRLFLSRDRLGIRPLFYARTPEGFLFGSEVKCLLAHPGMRRALDVRGLAEVFTAWAPQAPQTVFEGVEELSPGSNMLVTAGDVRVSAYWEPSYEPAAMPPFGDGLHRTADDYSDELLALLVDATRLRLRSDVPVGSYLSGGLDSSVITGIIRKYTDNPLRTFSVAFEDSDFDESRYQREVVEALDTEHQEVRCSYDDIADVFPTVVWHAEKPLVRTAAAPLYILSKLVQDDNYKVVLTGEGSDEILGGYDIFKEAKIRRFWGKQPDSRFRPLLLRRLYPYMKNLQSQSPAYLKAFFCVQRSDLESPFFSHLPRWNLTSRLQSFFSEDVKAQVASLDVLGSYADALPEAFSDWDPLCQAQYLEMTGLMPGYILSSQGDRMTMGHSVEGRFPFLDYRVVEFASRLPVALKLRVLDEKHLLKRAAAPFVPASVLRRPKQPYRAPDAASFFGAQGRAGQGKLAVARRDYVRSLLAPEKLKEDGIFDVEAVTRLVQKAERGRVIGTKDNMALVGVLSTQLMKHAFVDNFQTPQVPERAWSSEAREASGDGEVGLAAAA